MSQHWKFENRDQLNAAFGRIVDQAWVDSCTVDVPALELRIHVANGAHQRRHAEAWIARERRRRGDPPRD